MAETIRPGHFFGSMRSPGSAILNGLSNLHRHDGPKCHIAAVDLTPLTAIFIVRWKFFPSYHRGARLENSTWVSIAEAGLRVMLGWRLLISGLSNIRRWPSPVTTASILFPQGATFFGFVATCLMVLGGIGVAAGIQTPLSAVMIIIFLIPTFGLHWHWLKVLPAMVPVVTTALKEEKARNYFRVFDRQSYHAHEVGLRDNLVFVAAALYFAVKGSTAFGVDNWFSGWVIRVF